MRQPKNHARTPTSGRSTENGKRSVFMRAKAALITLTIVIFSLATYANEPASEILSAQAVSEDYPAAMSAIRELRTMGPVGLDALFVKYAAEIERYAKTGELDKNWLRIANALDTVAMQKDAYASHLYWYSDLGEAKRVAKTKNKPILTLRLLGNLNEEFSCANSRLFRAVLYPNADISRYLRANYILHWKSVRPAPRITIDFGDGRKIERTITGNSIHYVLSANGNVVDAIPGLYSPAAFLKYIKGAADVSRSLAGLPAKQQDLALLKYRKA